LGYYWADKELGEKFSDQLAAKSIKEQMVHEASVAMHY